MRDFNVFGIIPARYASSRFPGKPLALINGKPMVQWVYERVQSSEVRDLAVATDDERIAECVRGFGGRVVMTSPDHASGTDRCGEAALAMQPADNDVVINIQGDEPLISPKEIHLLASAFEDRSVQIATLVNPFHDDALLQNPNVVKVVKAKNGNVLYFSRLPIPYLRGESAVAPKHYYRHIGIYAYRYGVLRQIVQLPTSELENSEKLEQLRWLENGYTIRALECDYQGIGVDTPEDLALIQNVEL
ncbi:MAG: 3-deoxy-manno-octulosonate cytidylyltransferase [Bacteroidales bacterium]|nr:3-deoxy-manno-octulosonate cytidylyltransferase [Bacteroidales bacterium]